MFVWVWSGLGDPFQKKHCQRHNGTRVLILTGWLSSYLYIYTCIYIIYLPLFFILDFRLAGERVTIHRFGSACVCACCSFELESGRLCSLCSTSLWTLSILHGSSWGGKLIFSLVPLETANKCRRVHNLEQDQKLQIRKISVKENDMFRDSKTVQTHLFLAFLPTPTEGGAALFQPS